MAELNKCFKIHLNLSLIDDLNAFINNVAKLADIMLDNDHIYVWLDDDKNKSDLIRFFKKNKVKEYFCEPIEYNAIGKDNEFNFISAWFMENYRAYIIRDAERQNQRQLREMYNNIQKAQEDLKNKINRGGDSLDDKKTNLKEAYGDNK